MSTGEKVCEMKKDPGFSRGGGGVRHGEAALHASKHLLVMGTDRGDEGWSMEWVWWRQRGKWSGKECGGSRWPREGTEVRNDDIDG